MSSIFIGPNKKCFFCWVSTAKSRADINIHFLHTSHQICMHLVNTHCQITDKCSAETRARGRDGGAAGETESRAAFCCLFPPGVSPARKPEPRCFSLVTSAAFLSRVHQEIPHRKHGPLALFHTKQSQLLYSSCPTWLPIWFSTIWPGPSFPLRFHLLLLGPSVQSGDGAREGMWANTNIVPPAFTSQESEEVNKQVLVFNCDPFIALPSSVLECSTPPFFLSICPSPWLTSLNISSLPAWAAFVSAHIVR